MTMKMYEAIMAKRRKRSRLHGEHGVAAGRNAAAVDQHVEGTPDDLRKQQQQQQSQLNDTTAGEQQLVGSPRPRVLRRPSRKLQEGKCNKEDTRRTDASGENTVSTTAVAPQKLTPGTVLESKRCSSSETPNPAAPSDNTPIQTIECLQPATQPQSTASDVPIAHETTPVGDLSLSPGEIVEPLESSPQPDDILNQCWICAVPLKFDDPDMVCWYATHPHAYFPGVPVCAVCATDIPDAKDDDDDVCCGCFHDTSALLVLCDACPNAYCTECLSQFYNVEQLTHDDTRWECPQCRPVLPELLEPDEAPLEELLDRLYHAELEHERCDRTVDAAHEYRVADCISQVLESIWNQHQISSEQIYKSLLPDVYGWAPSEPSLSDELLAKANAAVDQRRSHQTLVGMQDEYDTRECFDDVEDLGAMDDEEERHLSESVRKRGGWAGVGRPRRCEIDVALANESSMNIRVKTTFQEQEDKDRVDGDEDETVMPKRTRTHQSKQHLSSTQTAVSGANVPTKRRKASTSVITNSKQPETTPSKRQRTHSTPNNLPTTSTNTATDIVDSLLGSPGLPLSKVVPGTPKEIQGPVQSSDYVLCDTQMRRVAIDPNIAKHLKPHQLEAAQFMWNNCFADFETKENGDDLRMSRRAANSTTSSPGDSVHTTNSTGDSDGLPDAPTVGGCVLAHAMGLGKSLSSISLIHTLMTHPELKDSNEEKLISRVLLIAPVNTLANWENEWIIWQKEVANKVNVYNISNFHAKTRTSQAGFWMNDGGVFLVSDGTFKTLAKECVLQPDVVVLDEAHTMLKNSQTQIYKALQTIRTPRRIALTGTPFQNNLKEYYYLINYIRPGILNVTSEKQFEDEFMEPIKAGSAKDSDMKAVEISLQTAKTLSERIKPYLHRKDTSALMDYLPPMQYNVLHVYPTRLQSKLYGLYKKRQSSPNFFAQFKALNGIHTHPGGLCFPSDVGKTSNEGEAWWQSRLDKEGEEGFLKVHNGNKIVVLLHIIAHSLQAGDKVLVFSNSLANLNYIEYVLSLSKWEEHVPSLATMFPGQSFGSWTKGLDFDRIDGTKDAAERGDLVNQFADKTKDVKVFLISKAGGIGINLISANRVVLMDTHFNPTIASQAIHRTYRYGQEKPVYCYQLLTHGTLEEKVYSRCVNKTGLSYLVIDDKAIKRNFNEQELENLMQTLCWVQCEKCEKWRCLGDSSAGDDLPDEWFCSMNPDVENNSCGDRERSQLWYEKKFAGMSKPKLEQHKLPEQPKNIVDPLMSQLWDLKMRSKNTCILAKHYLHDNLLKTTSCADALEEVQEDLKSQQDLLTKTQPVLTTPHEAHKEVPQVPQQDTVVDCGPAKQAAAPTPTSTSQAPFLLSQELGFARPSAAQVPRTADGAAKQTTPKSTSKPPQKHGVIMPPVTVPNPLQAPVRPIDPVRQTTSPTSQSTSKPPLSQKLVVPPAPEVPTQMCAMKPPVGGSAQQTTGPTFQAPFSLSQKLGYVGGTAKQTTGLTSASQFSLSQKLGMPPAPQGPTQMRVVTAAPLQAPMQMNPAGAARPTKGPPPTSQAPMAEQLGFVVPPVVASQAPTQVHPGAAQIPIPTGSMSPIRRTAVSPPIDDAEVIDLCDDDDDSPMLL